MHGYGPKGAVMARMTTPAVVGEHGAMGHESVPANTAAGHGGHGAHPEPAAHGGHGQHDQHAGHGGHGDHVAMFRRRFWWSLLLTIPIVVTSEMVMDWFGYELHFTGISWVG